MLAQPRVNLSYQLLIVSLGVALCVAAPVGAAPQIGPLGGGLHGVGLLPDEGAQMAYGVWVAATSRDPEATKPEPLPADLAERIKDTEQGVYTRDEWNKGAALRDRWSARWTGTLDVEKADEYTFYLTTDDGARMKVDGGEIIDAWVPRPPTTSEAKVNLAAGDHEVVVEYFEAGGGAVARLEWSAEGMERQVVPAARVTRGGQPGWEALYFNNIELNGQPWTAHVETIDNDWGEGGPRVGEEEPGEVVLEWTRIAPDVILGRIHAGPDTKLGLFAQAVGQLEEGQGQARGIEDGVWIGVEGQPRFAIEMIGSVDGLACDMSEPIASVWAPATDASYTFIAGFRAGMEPLPTIIPPAQEMLRQAATRGAKPNLPPGLADDEGWITLFDGKSFDGWKFRSSGSQGHWQITEQGELDNAGGGGVDLYTEWTFMDCDLHVEFKYPRGSNSGVYLQGRYEIQLLDSAGQPVSDHQCGAVYRLVAPSQNVTRPPGEWQSLDISFTSAGIDDNGRIVPARMSVTHNDVLTIEDAEVPRATGGEMNRRYLEPGPIMLQGTHGPVTFRNIKVKPK